MDGAREPQDAGQRPHTPGQDPQGSGAPRDGDERPDAERAPLGGDRSTEERLEADTAVEEDALKALDPDDTPA